MAQIIYTDGATTKGLNPWDESRPEAWTFLSNAPQKELDAMFYRVAASFRAVNKRATVASEVPFQLLRGKEVIDDSTKWENKVGFLDNPTDLIRRVSLSLTFTNAAYLLMGKNALGMNKSLNYLVPTTINPIVEKGVLVRFERQVNNQIEKYPVPSKEFFYLWQLDHTTELLPTRNTAAQAIMNATGVIYFQDVFVKNFFERGGVKPTIVGIKGVNISTDRRDEIERGWTRFLNNVSKWKAKLINSDSLDIQPIGAGADDLQKNEIYRQAIENIALGVGMPVSELLSDWDSYATAMVDRMAWMRDDIFPHARFIAAQLNSQIFTKQGLTLKFLTETSDAETEDEVQRAEAFSKYVQAGIKPSIAAQIVGMELPDGVEYEMLDKMAEENEQKEMEKEKRSQQAALELQAAKNPPAPAPSKKPASKWLPSVDEFKELSVWRDVSLRRLKKGESLDFDYQPHYGGLPDGIAESIRAALLGATSQDEIKAAFDVDFETETVTPAPAYKTDPGLLALAEALNAYTKATTTTEAQPVVIVNNQKPKRRVSLVKAFAESAFMQKEGEVDTNRQV